MDRRVKFPHNLVFHDMVKDGDSSEMTNFFKRPSVADPEGIINSPGDQAGPALHTLVKEGNLKCVRVLVNLGADVNMPNEEGWRPLHICALTNNIDVAKFLVKRGANPDLTDHQGRTPVDLTDDFDLIELLMMYSPEETRRKSMAK
ncbi:protein phosphatase 1 regulatory subunit 27 [Exaiptasia diaphana]|uniref:Uncharacterized protein n=1 Tax=Exaiptasia diaphana TaxID=2652724 RepID=A0A913WRL2_EXADI|nr:protein phosphatase 1 regulatory subunit 27 [Exaiptasia diaphana]KXJ27966.1 Protein phosphatase 1 regulatory subunit 27 [Exaiptasia diaphana]